MSIPDKSIVDVFWRRVEQNGEKPAILQKVDGAYMPVIWREHGRAVEMAMAGLAQHSVRPGDKVAILSQPCQIGRAHV